MGFRLEIRLRVRWSQIWIGLQTYIILIFGYCVSPRLFYRLENVGLSCIFAGNLWYQSKLNWYNEPGKLRKYAESGEFFANLLGVKTQRTNMILQLTLKVLWLHESIGFNFLICFEKVYVYSKVTFVSTGTYCKSKDKGFHKNDIWKLKSDMHFWQKLLLWILTSNLRKIIWKGKYSLKWRCSDLLACEVSFHFSH